jgi:hypothetical protein
MATFLRNTAFASYGLIYFTNKAFERRHLPALHGRDLHGKIVIITGANNGLGREAALQYAQQGSSSGILYLI